MDSEYKKVINSDHVNWSPFLRQLLVICIIWSSYLVGGLGMGAPTVVVPQLRKEANSTEVISSEMASWLTSVTGYAATISVFVIVPVGHYFGRKLTLNIVTASIFISTTILYISKTAIYFFISQVIFGILSAAQATMFLLILSEYTSPKYRGIFLTIKSASFFWGIWIANAIGIFTHYKYIGLVGMALSGINFVVSLIIPESPYWLAFMGRYDECSVAHRCLKGIGEQAENELTVLIESQQELKKIKTSADEKTLIKYFHMYLAAIKDPEVFKPLLLCCLVFSIYHLSGKLVCAVYAIEMISKFTGNQSKVYSGVLILDGFTVFGMYVGCGLSKILKRRTLLLSTSITGTILLFAMSIYLYLVRFSIFSVNSYIIIAMLVGYSLAICSGPIILATTISAELLPLKFRSFANMIFAIYCTLLYGTVVKVSPYVFNAVGFQGAYLVFGISMVIILTLIYKNVPETKDKTLHEIEAMFKSPESNQKMPKPLLNG